MVCKRSSSEVLERSCPVLEWETAPPPCPETGRHVDSARFLARPYCVILKDTEVQIPRGLRKEC